VLCFRCGSHNPDGSEFCQHCGQNLLSVEKLAASEKSGGKVVLPQPKSEGSELKPGQFLAERYQVKSLLGAGPSGVVWRARDMEIEVDVAVKVFHSNLLQTREERNHFQSVIRGVRAIQHQNLVRIYGEEQDNDRCFVVMQLLEGLSLRKIISLRVDKKQVFQPAEIEPIFAHLCQALEKIHETSMHGNLKPENIIILPDILKVTDLGLFEGLPRKPFLAAQKAASRGGIYLAPEVQEGEGKASPAVDIYSLGVILCEMLTGKVYEGPATSLPEMAGETARWQKMLVRALNENPERRQSTVQEFFDDLREAAGSAGPARKASGGASRSVEKPKTAEAKSVRVAARAPQPEYPPTVVDARTAAGEKPSSQLPDSPIPVSEEQIIEDIVESSSEGQADLPVSDEQILQEAEDMDQFLPEEASEPGEETAGEGEEEFTEGETVTEPGPPPAMLKNMEARVARPITPMAAQAPAPAPKVAVAPKSQPAIPAQQALSTKPPVPTAPAGASYGPFSQPPFPPSFVTQPPVPKPIGWAVYIFLAGVLIIVGVGVYFLIDYLRAQAELARAQAQAALLQRQPAQPPPVAVVEPKAEEKPLPTPAEPMASQAGAQPSQPAQPVVQPAAAQTATPSEPLKTPEAEKAATQAEVVAEPAQALGKPPATMAALIAATEKNEEAKTETRRREVKRQVRPAPTAAKQEEKKAVEVAQEAPAPVQKASAALPPVEEPPDTTAQPAPKAVAPAPAAPQPATPAPAPAAVVTASPVPPAAEAPATPKEEKKDSQVAAASPKCPAGMVFIPAGKASIGSSADDPMRNFGELKLQTVEVNAFCIDLFEYPNAKGKKPTVGVSFNDAKNLCKKRGKRLCSEVEWEYACKGAGNRRYPYGNQYSAESCNTKDAQGNDRPLAESGSFSACRSPFGVWDMSGNLSEWTDTPFAPGAPAMTFKGGSSLRPDWATRCAARSSGQPGMRKEDLGFRCCAEPK